MERKETKKASQAKIILFYLLIIGVILIAIAQILPWAEPYYSWGISIGGDHYYFWEYLIDLFQFGFFSLEHTISAVMGFFLFPLSIYVLVKAIKSAKYLNKDMIHALKRVRSTGITGIFTIIWFYFFLMIKSVDLDWSIGTFLFLTGSILFIATAVIIHYVVEVLYT